MEPNKWPEIESLKLLNMDKIEFREYQYNIIKAIIKNGSTLVVLPTGLGKTFIGFAIMAEALFNGKRALFLATTKPLAEQHYQSSLSIFRLNKEEIALVVGYVSKKKRKDMLENAKIIFATPQTIANEMKKGNMSLSGFGAVIFDECHRAVGKYAYTYIANECNLRNILVVGLTASPGGNKEKIKELLGTLGIRHIEARSNEDLDVAKYVMPKYIQFVPVEITDTIKEISDRLREIGNESIDALRGMGISVPKSMENLPKGIVIKIGKDIEKIGEKEYKFGVIYHYVRLINVLQSFDLVTTEGIGPFVEYAERLEKREEKSRGVLSLIKDQRFQAAKNLALEAAKRGEEHPKVIALLDILRKEKGKNAIVFAQYRSTIKVILEFLTNNGFKAERFVGKREGVTQSQQKEVIERFRNNEFNVLVASSIGEEGLDIPSVDVVVFYEPIPSEIRNIQRRGRTGRVRAGKVFIIYAKNTKDQVYLYVAQKRERKMKAIIESLNKEMEINEEGQRKLA
ncbi:MAG: helicase-related protein [Candidatus Micrarchaeaceae archaeon]